MKRFEIDNINTPDYWNNNQTALDYGLRQQKYLNLARAGDKIIELGCGLSPMLAHACYFNEAWGVDFSPKTIDKAEELYPDVKYVCADACHTGINEEFDTVVSGEVIEHLENPTELLEEMDRLCKRGGRMILSTPHLEFSDLEHLWEFEEADFKLWGFNTEIVHSDRFKGRSYIFAWKDKK